MIRAGELRERIEVWKGVEQTDARGQTKMTYEPWCSRPANVESLTGYEQMRAQQVGMTVTHRVRLRYLKGLTGSNRILHRGTFYEIVGLQDMDVRTTHELICQVLMEQPVQK